MRRFLLLTLLFLIAAASPSLAREELNLLDPAFRWGSPDRTTKVAFQNSKLVVSSQVNTIRLFNALPLGVSTKQYDLLVIKMKTSKDGIAELFWTRQGSSFSANNNYPFYVKKANYIDLAVRDKDQLLDHLLIYPFLGAGTAEISELRLVRATFGEKLLAGWQEVSGPISRIPDGFEFLVTRSPRLFGRPVFYYLNWLLGSLLVLVIAVKPRRDWRRFFILVILVSWFGLEINSQSNNWRSFNRNWQFYGKSLETKRAMANTGDFYSFIRFLDKTLPADTSIEVVVADPYNYFRALYYLAPRENSAHPSYLIVYDAKPDRNKYRRFKFWQEFRPGAYVLH